ncbi:hypothetical protein, partial [Pseudomonas fluorescens]|uniref:hypothetical protein n=2 Tax=Bacteria TaxID=2 RepID=UPI002B1DA37A
EGMIKRKTVFLKNFYISVGFFASRCSLNRGVTPGRFPVYIEYRSPVFGIFFLPGELQKRDFPLLSYHLHQKRADSFSCPPFSE